MFICCPENVLEDKTMFLILAGLIGIPIIVAVIAAIATVVSVAGYQGARQDDEE